jgi:hypothetical protein
MASQQQTIGIQSFNSFILLQDGQIYEFRLNAARLAEDEDEEGETQWMEASKEEEWDCEEGGEGILARLNAEEGEIRYPYNCIALITSHFPNKDHSFETVHGVGVLIRPSLVVTCAHLVNFLFSDSGERKEAKTVMATCDGQIAFVEQFLFPKEYRDPRHPNRREFDFALLLLEQKIAVKDSKYLWLAEDYQTTSDVQMPMVQRVEGQGDYSFRIVPQNKMGMEMSTDTGILEHGLATQKGDSGTPLLVQPPGLDGACLAIAIHTSYSKSTNQRKSVRFTRTVVDALAGLEKRMTQQPASRVNVFASCDYEGLKEGKLVEAMRRIGERVSQQFLPLIEEARQREAAMTKEQRKLRDEAQQFI